MQELLDRMCERVLRHADGLRLDTPLPGIGLGVAHRPSTPVNTVYKPMACLVLQGAKQVLIGDRRLRYDPASCFIASIDLPATGSVIEASHHEPYLVASLAIDPEALVELLDDMPALAADDPSPGFGVAPVTPELLGAWDHVLALLDSPADIPFLFQSRQREILYRFLQGEQGPMLRQIAREGSRLSRVRSAIGWIRDHYDQTIRTKTLADIAGMSVPTFHRHFKAATAMSPLQYQKALRLQKARQLLASAGEAARTAYAVGYESASQFSREYAREFGTSPKRDAKRLHANPAAALDSI